MSKNSSVLTFCWFGLFVCIKQKNSHPAEVPQKHFKKVKPASVRSVVFLLRKYRIPSRLLDFLLTSKIISLASSFEPYGHVI